MTTLQTISSAFNSNRQRIRDQIAHQYHMLSGQSLDDSLSASEVFSKFSALVHSRPDILCTFQALIGSAMVPAKAMAKVLEIHPDVTRKEFFHTAVKVGISIRAAKSYYDRNNKLESTSEERFTWTSPPGFSSAGPTAISWFAEEPSGATFSRWNPGPLNW